MNDNTEYILQDENVLVIHNDQIDENGYPLTVEIDYAEYDRIQSELE